MIKFNSYKPILLIIFLIIIFISIKLFHDKIETNNLLETSDFIFDLDDNEIQKIIMVTQPDGPAIFDELIENNEIKPFVETLNKMQYHMITKTSTDIDGNAPHRFIIYSSSSENKIFVQVDENSLIIDDKIYHIKKGLLNELNKFFP